jgi:hypothetical protein
MSAKGSRTSAWPCPTRIPTARGPVWRSSPTLAAAWTSMRAARTLVWHTGDQVVVACFSLAAHLVVRADLPPKIGRGSPDALPAVLLARLASPPRRKVWLLRERRPSTPTATAQRADPARWLRAVGFALLRPLAL